jgi:hypothetical protein
VARLEGDGAVSIRTIARATGLEEDVVGRAVVGLRDVHDVLVERADDPDGVGAGATYQLKARAT